MTPTASDTIIPTEKQPAVTRALISAFGASEVEDVRLLTGGLTTAQVYRIVVAGRPYLLRLIMRMDAMADPTDQFANMQRAAEAGIAPRVWIASVEDRLLITDFVETQPFPADMALRMASVLKTLHALPDFPPPKGIPSYFSFIDGMVQQVQATGILPESQTAELFARYADITRVYPRRADELVASHNDLKPQNITFDGTRVWLIDWEAAFLNDRYVDLAIVANFFVDDEAEEAAYLEAYFGAPASAVQRARFYLMGCVMHVSYLTFLLLMAARSGTVVDANRPAPDFHDFHRRLITGEADLGDEQARLDYALVHRDALQRKIHTARFAESVALLEREFASG